MINAGVTSPYTLYDEQTASFGVDKDYDQSDATGFINPVSYTHLDVYKRQEQGYAQVLWLDGVEKKYVEEVGSMNIMFKIDGKVYTAATVGTVLPGVTRRSCIELLKDWGYEVIEGKLAIADIMQAARDGKLEEVFGTGTAAVVSPVKELVWKGEHAYIGDGKIGAVTQKLYDTMTGMQWGKIPDTKGWIVPVEKKY